MDTVEEICSISGCVSETFADYIGYWKHNGHWLFNSTEELRQLALREGLDLSGTTMFYYEVFERQLDESSREWSSFWPDDSLPTDVQAPKNARLIGYDIATFWAGSSPECSPLSCNGVASDVAVNRHCLLETLTEAVQALEAGVFDDSEPGPFRVFSVHVVDRD